MHFSLNYYSKYFFYFLVGVIYIINLIGCLHNPSHTLVILNKPVVDFFTTSENVTINKICASGQSSKCPRQHQGLFNEHFCLIEQTDRYLKIISSDIKDAQNQEIPFEIEASRATIVTPDHPLLRAIPAFNPQETIITLLFSWNGYSLGTQFVVDQEKDPEDTYNAVKPHRVLVPDFNNNTFIKEKIDPMVTTDCLPKPHQNNIFSNNRIPFLVCLIEILKQASFRNATIPYVWGGTSFIANHNTHPFYEENGNWHLQRADTSLPYTGFDCSGLIWRTLKMAKISAPWRNTNAMAKHFAKVTSYQDLKKGDLLWFSGHIMVIKNKKKGTLIEARGYGSGYGKVHKINVADLFNEVTSLAQMFELGKKNQPLSLKRKEPCYEHTDKVIAEWNFLAIPQ